MFFFTNQLGKRTYCGRKIADEPAIISSWDRRNYTRLRRWRRTLPLNYCLYLSRSREAASLLVKMVFGCFFLGLFTFFIVCSCCVHQTCNFFFFFGAGVVWLAPCAGDASLRFLLLACAVSLSFLKRFLLHVHCSFFLFVEKLWSYWNGFMQNKIFFLDIYIFWRVICLWRFIFFIG